MENREKVIDYDHLANQILSAKDNADLNIAQILRRSKVSRQIWIDLISHNKHGKNTENIGRLAKALGLSEVTLKII